MRRLILVLATMGVAVLLASGAALGITNGHADEGSHPYVGALVDIPNRANRAPEPYCTGTLISPTIFLTAAHCYPEKGNTSYVIFDEVPTSTSKIYSGTFHDHPVIDIAVVEFNAPIPDFDPTELPELPTVGQFNDAQKGDKFTAVGYGGYLAPKQPGGPLIVYDDKRQWAVGTLNRVTQTSLLLSQKHGSGGTCYGDSGGPNFAWTENNVSETNVIASITITGDAWCKLTNVTLRLDRARVQAFLDTYV